MPSERSCRCTLATILLALCLAACTTLTQPARPAPAPQPAKPTAPGGLKPFQELARGSQRSAGFLTVFHRAGPDDHYLLELSPKDFDRPLLLTLQRTHGIAERGLWGGVMLDATLVSFHRVPNDRVQLIEHNTRYFADGNRPLEHALSQAYPDSILGSAPIVSQPRPDSHAVLVDLSAWLLSDMPAGTTALERAFHLGYALDRSNSQILSSRNSAEETSFAVQLHYSLGRLPPPPSNPAMVQELPSSVPDVRSITMQYAYSFSPLPERMTPRLADARVGYFQQTRWDFREDWAAHPQVHYIKRWRLEKAEPEAALSAPRKPIVFWIDRNVPERYRQAVRAGILMWNPAFERIGFKDAIEVRQQGEDDEFDTADRRHASVRWFFGNELIFAQGPSVTDPRSGEILDADVIVSDAWSRFARNEFSHRIAATVARGQGLQDDCLAQAQTQFQATADELSARGEMAPGSAQEEAFIQNTLRYTVAHEIGHALGLGHNFKGSMAYSPAQLRDPVFVAAHGTSASIMDYLPANQSLAGEAPSQLWPDRIGPYDEWAIAYGYSQFPAPDEAAALAALLAQGQHNALLAYGSDQDAGQSGFPGADPDANRFDLGQDSEVWFTRRARLLQELWQRLAHQALPPDACNAAPREALERSLALLSDSAQTLAKKVGGVRQQRQPTAQAPASFIPVPAPEQRRALATLAQQLFAPDSLQLPAALLGRLAPDQLERLDNNSAAAPDPALPIASRILQVQVTVLDQLLSDRTAHRLLEAQLLRTHPQDSLALAELLSRLQDAIWPEQPSPRTSMTQRNLQRVWASRLATLITRPNPSTPPDLRSLARVTAQRLLSRISQAQHRPHDALGAAHLAECRATLSEALHATTLRNPG